MIQLVNKINVFKLRNKAKESFLSMSFCIEIYNSEFEPWVFGPAQVQALAMIYSGSSSGSDLSSILAMAPPNKDGARRLRRRLNTYSGSGYDKKRTQPTGSGSATLLIVSEEVEYGGGSRRKDSHLLFRNSFKNSFYLLSQSF